jgi:hypothetical protein
MTTYRPHTVYSAPAESKATLEALTKGLGFLPNLFATMAESPPAPGASGNAQLQSDLDAQIAKAKSDANKVPVFPWDA